MAADARCVRARPPRPGNGGDHRPGGGRPGNGGDNRPGGGRPVIFITRILSEAFQLDSAGGCATGLRTRSRHACNFLFAS
jgi:hypothetical protein